MANQVDYRDPTPNNFPQDYDPAKADPRVKLRSDSIKHKQKGVDTREAMYQSLEIGSVTANEAKETAVNTASRQDESEKKVQDTSDNVNNVLAEITKNSGDTAAPEVIGARKPSNKPSYKTLGERLDNEHNNNPVDESLVVGGYTPDYFQAEINRVKVNLTSDLFTFTQMNDTHWETLTRNKPEAYRSLNHLKNLLSFADVSDLLLLNGDNTNSDLIDLNGGRKDIETLVDVYLDEPTTGNADRFINLGNHDDGSTRRGRLPNQALTSDQFMHDAEFRQMYQTETNQGETRNGDSLYFYKDYPEKKIRFITLNTSDVNEDLFDENGSLKYARWLSHTIRQEQLTWLATVALNNVPEDYHVVVSGHAPLNANIGGWTDNGSIYMNFGIILSLLAAFRDGTNYHGASTDADFPVSIFADFTNQGPRNLVGYFCGHTHRDALSTYSDITICEVACSVFYNNNSNRFINTATEDGFDVIQIDTDNRKVNISGFGYCEDRGFNY